MAAKLEVFLETTKWFDPIAILKKKLSNRLRMKEMIQMDDWTWAKQQKVACGTDLQEFVNSGKIILADLYDAEYGNAGISIERVGAHYLYSCWLDTKELQALDSDAVTEQNAMYYQKIYQLFTEFVCTTGMPYRYLAIGSEVVLESQENMEATIRNAIGIAAWIVKEDISSIKWDGTYECHYLQSVGGYLLEKKR